MIATLSVAHLHRVTRFGLCKSLSTEKMSCSAPEAVATFTKRFTSSWGMGTAAPQRHHRVRRYHMGSKAALLHAEGPDFLHRRGPVALSEFVVFFAGVHALCAKFWTFVSCCMAVDFPTVGTKTISRLKA